MVARKRRTASEEARDRLRELLLRLNLTAIEARWEELLATVDRRKPSYTEFLLELLELEDGVRQERRCERLLKRSHIGTCESLEDFDFKARPKLEAAVVKELLSCDWVREKRPLICVGGPGKGKSTISKILGAAAIDEGFSVLYVEHTVDMLRALSGARVDGTYRRLFRRYEKPQLLICDEFGYQEFGNEATDDLFRLISARHNKASTLIVANQGFRSWHAFFPTKAHAVATVDRLVDRATILRFTGKSFRRPRDIHGAPLDEE